MKQTDSTIEFLLAVARDAIGLRVRKDDGDPAAYDHEKDPEGYIVSLINALHCWCHVNGLPWDAQLERAEQLFEEDLPQPNNDEMTCPSCGYNESKSNDGTYFSLDYPEWGGLFDYDEPSLDKYTSCECPKCYHTGPFSQFRLLPPNKESTTG